MNGLWTRRELSEPAYSPTKRPRKSGRPVSRKAPRRLSIAERCKQFFATAFPALESPMFLAAVIGEADRSEAREFVLETLKELRMNHFGTTIETTIEATGERIVEPGHDPFGIADYNRKSAAEGAALESVIDETKKVTRANLNEFDSHVASLVASQAAEIRRLQAIILDATQIPPRHPVILCTMGQQGIAVLANDHSVWHLASAYGADWTRMASLPLPADEI